MTESAKWLVQIVLATLIVCVVIWLLYLTGLTGQPLILASVVLFSILFVFFFIALKHYYSIPYQVASNRLRSMIRGDMDDLLPASTVGEATDLFSTINDLASELKAKSKMIEKLEHMRIDFVANVSHELKTPLTSIKGYTETLKEGAISDPNVNIKFLDRIDENANRLIAIISDLLTLSRIESFTQEIDWNTFEATALTQKLDTTFLPNLEKKKQSIKLNFADKLLEGDLKKLEQVFINLVDNANRYSPQGTVIEIKQSKDDLHWNFEVSDNGPGIPAQHQPRIFERFYRVDPDRNRDTGGTGLGLAIVKHIVLLHDGTIRLESAVGHGTRFFIQFPRHLI